MTPQRLRSLLAIAVSIAVAVVVFALVLPAIARYGAVWRELQMLAPAWTGGLLAAVLLNVITSALPWRVMLPGLGIVSALRVTQASTALISVFPGGAPAGMALSFAMLRSRGIGAEATGLTVALTGIWSQLSTFVFPVAALALVAVNGSVPRPLGWAAALSVVLIVIAAGVLALGLTSPRRARSVGNAAHAVVAGLHRLVRRPPPRWDGMSVVRLRESSLRAMRRHGLALTLATLANQLTGFIVLDLSLRAVGIGFAQISAAESFTAWSLARLIESLPLTPGGLGLVELGLVGTLAGFGAPHAKLVAAVLLYRALVVAPTLVLGALAGLTWKLRWQAPPAPPR